MRFALNIISLIILLALTAAKAVAADDQANCIANAFKGYNDANLALMLRSDALMTVKTAIAQRRLEEDYCIKEAHCETDAIPSQNSTMPLDAAFSICLKEEAKEKYELK